MTELEMRCAEALDALTKRLDVTTKAYQTLYESLSRLSAGQETLLKRLDELESTLSRLEDASTQLRRLS